ncbi:hypothetical protein [Legionella worsleiensis]|uniref:Uncharacterized protein n=1 Tax=Legionella worsleiensis TaxID=45076 RepID=A0A0W1ALA7_9GAMM|nr:hypothetical protein [Legionella worsleiensis]KTD82138.1 hypothetical protein Lwor_0058 [Legionella worsleiensis]STY31393.1 Uncharacterised protein [Legionella worsleiensis]
MRYLVSILLFFPLLSSCTVVEEHYYDRGYYVPAPRVEVRPVAPQGYYHAHPMYRPVRAAGVYHGHPDPYANKVVVAPRPRSAQAQGGVNVHGHTGHAGTVHGHGGNTGTIHGHNNPANVHSVHKHPQTKGGATQLPPGVSNGSAVQPHSNKSHGHR